MKHNWERKYSERKLVKNSTTTKANNPSPPQITWIFPGDKQSALPSSNEVQYSSRVCECHVHLLHQDRINSVKHLTHNTNSISDT